MKPLTQEEVRELEHGTNRAAAMRDGDEGAIQRLTGRGLLRLIKTGEDSDWEYFDPRTTPAGLLALRVHRAYLASLGAQS